MSTCNITGTIKDSGGVALDGQLWVELDLQIVDESPTPDDIYTTKIHKFTITAGVVNLNLAESETQRVSYRFRFFAANEDFDTGIDETPTFDFHALVPNLASVNLSELIPTGITKDTLDTAIARLARVLTSNADFAEALRGGPNPMGAYSALTYYRSGDFVSYGGSGWLYINSDPAVGQTPSELNTTYWMLASQKGDAGGTGGQDTAYDATGWNGALWAPSANAVRDKIETLAPLANPVFSGNPEVPLQLLTNASDRAASTLYVTNKITDSLANAAFTTQSNTDSSTKPATTAYVKNVFHRYSRMIDSKSSGSNGGSASSGSNTRTLNTIVTNAGDIVSLSSNTFTLRPGTYRIRAIAPGYQVGVHRLFLWSVTAGSRTLTGGNAFCNTTEAVQTQAELEGIFTIAVNTDFQLRHYCASAAATYGLGVAVSEASITETYAQVTLWRID